MKKPENQLKIEISNLQHSIFVMQTMIFSLILLAGGIILVGFITLAFTEQIIIAITFIISSFIILYDLNWFYNRLEKLKNLLYELECKEKELNEKFNIERVRDNEK